MRGLQTISLMLLLLLANAAVAQGNDSQPQASAQSQGQSQSDSDQQGTAPAPAFGQSAPILTPENPPISGIDEPRLDLRRALRSYISGGLGVSESADTNPANQLGSTSSVRSVSRVMGAADLQQFWAKSDLIAEYLGGGAFYAGHAGPDVRQIQSVGLLGVTRWRTGQITLRDSFDYLPEGSFTAGGFGAGLGLNVAEGGGYGIPGGGIPGTHEFGGIQFASVGLVPRITNVTIGDVVQALSPRSAVTLAAGFNFSHFLDDQQFLFNSQQMTVEAGYSYMLNRRDQLAGVVAFQEFKFPQSAGNNIQAYIFNARWGHTISGRMSMLLSLGPQYVSIYEPNEFCVPGQPPDQCLVHSSQERHLGLSARATLHYQFERSSFSANYKKFTSTGSGLFAGSDTQTVRLTSSRSLTRTWELLLDVGYAHEKRLSRETLAFTGDTTDSGFAGAILRKHFGRSFEAFGAYHFNETALDVSLCENSFGCGRIASRNVVTIGVVWHARPVRIE